jgi:energy-converting hydrogenase Eha subunit A
MKEWLIRFLVSRAGSVLTPVIATGVGAIVARLASYDPNLASSIDQMAVTGFVVALLVSLVNIATNASQRKEIKTIRAVANGTTPDGVTAYAEVRPAAKAEQP